MELAPAVLHDEAGFRKDRVAHVFEKHHDVAVLVRHQRPERGGRITGQAVVASLGCILF